MFILAILPAIVIILILILTKCIQKGKTKTLAKLFLLGLLSAVVVITLSLTVGEYIVPETYKNSIILIILYNMLYVALVEESVKYLFLVKGTKKYTDKKDIMTMIVYAIFVALGFATLENIFYLDGDTVFLAVKRALLSVPAHVAYEVIMGYNLAFAYRSDESDDKASARVYRIKALFIPTAIHWLLDMFLDIGETYPLVIFISICLIIGSYVYAVKLIKTAKKEHITNE